jgi:hypothetical protein
MRPSQVQRRVAASAGAGLAVVVAVIVANLVAIAGIVSIVRRNPAFGATVLKRYNALTLPTAGGRFSVYSVLQHTGRRSGRTYLTPVGAYPFGDGFVIGLTYGPTVDWCRNVIASGDAVLRWRGQELSLGKPAIISLEPHVLQAFPSPFRPILARELSQCLWLHRAP